MNGWCFDNLQHVVWTDMTIYTPSTINKCWLQHFKFKFDHLQQSSLFIKSSTLLPVTLEWWYSYLDMPLAGCVAMSTEPLVSANNVHAPCYKRQGLAPLPLPPASWQRYPWWWSDSMGQEHWQTWYGTAASWTVSPLIHHHSPECQNCNKLQNKVFLVRPAFHQI